MCSNEDLCSTEFRNLAEHESQNFKVYEIVFQKPRQNFMRMRGRYCIFIWKVEQKLIYMLKLTSLTY